MSEQRPVSVMIVDDEDLARERIRELLRNDPEVEIVAECSTGVEALSALIDLHPNLLFLDIQMPGMNGFDVLKKVDKTLMPMVIFVTAYDEYALRAFEFHACDYLLKPFKRRRFEETLAWAKAELRNRNTTEWARRTCSLLESLKGQPDYPDRLPIKDQGKVFFVSVREIDWIEADDNYIRIHAGKASHLVRRTIRSVEKELNPRCFIRIHRGAIVNVERIKELHQWFGRDYRVVLQNGTVLPLGRSYRRQLRSLLGSAF